MKQIDLDSANISLDKDRVLLINFKDDADVGIEEAEEIMNSSSIMVGEKQFYVLINAKDIFVSVDHKSRKYMAEHGIHKYNIAQAMVVNNMPVRIIANFYLNFYKHTYPMKVFTDIVKARKWLLLQC
tara:strand:+ start:2277 stop:2657 length:381 start_codon:yes stop_codon:yes gene_type:complete